ncbi:MAG: hypothetical protein QOJ92_1961 [Frankiales bacterium]|nr:hypothetical protein [Frankiales bacterium]
MQVESAYAEAVAALLDATPRDALERFDIELAAAIGQGLDEETGRLLRWWQRESVRAVRDHAAAVIPGVISGLLAAQAARADGAIADAVPASASSRPEALEPEPPQADATVVTSGAAETRRRTLVAGLLALPDTASA